MTDTPASFDSHAFCEALMTAHEGLSEEESHAFNARLILLLADHIGDADLLARAVEIAASSD